MKADLSRLVVDSCADGICGARSAAALTWSVGWWSWWNHDLSADESSTDVLVVGVCSWAKGVSSAKALCCRDGVGKGASVLMAHTPVIMVISVGIVVALAVCCVLLICVLYFTLLLYWSLLLCAPFGSGKVLSPGPRQGRLPGRGLRPLADWLFGRARGYVPLRGLRWFCGR